MRMHHRMVFRHTHAGLGSHNPILMPRLDLSLHATSSKKTRQYEPFTLEIPEYAVADVAGQLEPEAVSAAPLISDEDEVELEDKAVMEETKPSAPTRPYRYVEEVDLRERVYLVGAGLKRESNARSSSESYSIEESLEELGRLADTAGLNVVGSTFQMLEAPNQRTYIGEGKVLAIAREVRALDVETVIFDDSLSPGQLRNLEKAFETSEAGGVVKPCKVNSSPIDLLYDSFHASTFRRVLR